MTETTTTEFRAAFDYANGLGSNYGQWRETVGEAVTDAEIRERQFADANVAGTTKIQQRIVAVTTLEVPF